MIHFKKADARAALLSFVGALKKPSPGVHVLAGHLLNRDDSTFSKETFKKQLSDLSHCCDFIDYSEAVDCIKNKKVDLERPRLAFTFDDGFSDCYDFIAPVLNDLGVKACFFINPNFCLGDEKYINNFANNAVRLPGKKPMKDYEIKSLAREGHVIGAHTMDHVLLTSENSDFLNEQIVFCKEAVKNISGFECNDFAWTYGGYRHISAKAISVACKNYDNVFSSDNDGFYQGLDDRYLRVINRRHFEPYWPSSHVKFFLSKRKRYY